MWFNKKNKKNEKVELDPAQTFVQVDGEQVSLQTLLNAKAGVEETEDRRENAGEEIELTLQDAITDDNGDQHTLGDLIDAYRATNAKDEDEDKNENAEEEVDDDGDKKKAKKKKSAKKNEDEEDDDKENAEEDESDDKKVKDKSKEAKKKNNAHFVKINSLRVMGSGESMPMPDTRDTRLNRGKARYGSTVEAAK